MSPTEVLSFPSASLLMRVNSGGGRPWPVQRMVMEEPLLTEVGVACSATPVGGSGVDNNIELYNSL